MEPATIGLMVQPEAFANVVHRAGVSGKFIDEYVLAQHAIERMELLRSLGARYRYPVQEALQVHGIEADFVAISIAECRSRRVLLVRSNGQTQVFFVDPTDSALQTWVESRVQVPLTWVLVADSELGRCLGQLEGMATALSGPILHGAGSGPDARVRAPVEEISLTALGGTSSSVVRLVNSTLYDGLGSEASDIHFETVPAGLLVKYRIDGVLSEAARADGIAFSEQVISRIKVMAELDITERRTPQDGRFKARIRDRDVDFRVSIMPSLWGEDAVIRILDKQRLHQHMAGLTLDSLGFDATANQVIRNLARKPYGMFLVTGPTGSGKTTTLYAAINEINHGHDKIVTIEDPVEYQLPGVLQIPVNEKKGLTFARGLRSILRHDPDKIMVGEIRDGETAQIAVQAALTGHLVLTTVHANNVFDVLGRFTHMGVDPYSLVAALNGIVAQRLVRMSCPHCVEDDLPDAALVALSGIPDATEFRFRVGRGCAHCRGTGFKGRKAVAEVLVLDDELREMIVSREPVRRIKEAAARKGTRLMREVGLDLVRRGETSLQELNRVVA